MDNLTLYAELDDADLIERFRATLEREQRTMKAVVTLAVREYVAKSEAPAPKTRRTAAAPEGITAQ